VDQRGVRRVQGIRNLEELACPRDQFGPIRRIRSVAHRRERLAAGIGLDETPVRRIRRPKILQDLRDPRVVDAVEHVDLALEVLERLPPPDVHKIEPTDENRPVVRDAESPVARPGTESARTALDPVLRTR